MKVGSLVVCVEAHEGNDRVKPIYKGKIYTVREITYGKEIVFGRIQDSSDIGLLLEEIYNGIDNDFKMECGYLVTRFRELDTPQSISIEEILEEPVYA